MQVTKISELAAMEDEQLVMAITGTVDAVYEENTGVNDKTGKDWKSQAFILKDGKDKCRVTLFNQDPIHPSQRGKAIYICSTQGAKGWTGIKVGTYNKKKQLTVSESAEITFPGQEPAQQTQPPAQQQSSAPAKSDPPQQNQAQVNQQAPAKPTRTFEEEREAGFKEGVRKARIFLGRQANGYVLCLAAGHHVAEQYKETFQVPMTDGQFQGMVSSFFINFTRQNLDGDIPFGDMAPYLPKKQEPAK